MADFAPFYVEDADGNEVLISSQHELDNYAKDNGKFIATESLEELQKQEKRIKDRQEKEELENAKKVVRGILNRSHHRLDSRNRDRSCRSNYNLKEIKRLKGEKVSELDEVDGRRY